MSRCPNKSEKNYGEPWLVLVVQEVEFMTASDLNFTSFMVGQENNASRSSLAVNINFMCYTTD